MGVSLSWNQQDIKVFTALFTTPFISVVGPRGSVALTPGCYLSVAVGLSCRHVFPITGRTS